MSEDDEDAVAEAERRVNLANTVLVRASWPSAESPTGTDACDPLPGPGQTRLDPSEWDEASVADALTNNSMSPASWFMPVVKLYAAGCLPKEIAAQLGVAVCGVDHRVRETHKAAGTRYRHGLLAWLVNVSR